MIDPTNTAPISVHRPPMGRVLSAAAVIILLLTAVFFLMPKEAPAPGTPVIPPPTAEDAASNSILTPSLQEEFLSIQRRANSGEITREEADRLMRELYERVPVPEGR